MWTVHTNVSSLIFTSRDIGRPSGIDGGFLNSSEGAITEPPAFSGGGPSKLSKSLSLSASRALAAWRSSVSVTMVESSGSGAGSASRGGGGGSTGVEDMEETFGVVHMVVTIDFLFSASFSCRNLASICDTSVTGGGFFFFLSFTPFRAVKLNQMQSLVTMNDKSAI